MAVMMDLQKRRVGRNPCHPVPLMNPKALKKRGFIPKKVPETDFNPWFFLRTDFQLFLHNGFDIFAAQRVEDELFGFSRPRFILGLLMCQPNKWARGYCMC